MNKIIDPLLEFLFGHMLDGLRLAVDMDDAVLELKHHGLAVQVGSGTVLPDGTVTIPVTAQSSADLAGFRFVLEYDKAAFTVTEIRPADGLGGSFAANLGSQTGDDLVVTWYSAKNVSLTGDLFYITLKPVEGAAADTYPVQLSFRQNDMCGDRLESIPVQVSGGTVQIIQNIYGDVNGDGTVNTVDAALLRQYLAHFDDDAQTSDIVVAAGADVNGDGVVNGKDLVLLRKYMANYDEKTGTSSVVLGPKG